MAIRVGRGVVGRIREGPGGIVLQVQGASDRDAASVALERARADIANLDGGWRSAHGLGRGDRNNPKYVSEVMPAGTGPFLLIDGGFTPGRLLRTIPRLIADRLREAGCGGWADRLSREGGTVARGRSGFACGHALPLPAAVTGAATSGGPVELD